MNLWRKSRGGSSEQYAYVKNAAEADERIALLGKLLLFYLLFLPAWVWAQGDPSKVVPFDIPQQRVDEALIQFAEQAGLTFFVPFDQVEGITSNELIGSYSSYDALAILLSDTGLQAEISDQNRLSIINVSSGGENDMNNKSKVSAGMLGGLLGFLGLGDALAQSGGSEDGQPSTSRYAIEEITITSRRIEEGLQNAPLAVTALSGLELENRGALDVIDFADVAPNVSLKSNGAVSGFAAAPRTSIRGVGQSDFVINTDPAVGMYADGVYLGRSIGSVLDLVDVERVEALRGPQGTLFGRNSTGGAINIISKKPEIGAETNGYLTAGFGEDGYLLVRGSANIPIGDSSALRISGLKRERDGYIPLFQYDNLSLGAEDVSGLKAAFRWQPSDSFTLDLDADFSTRSDTAAPMVAVALGDLSVGENSGLDNVSTGTSTSQIARRFNNEAGFGPAIGNSASFQTQDAQCGTDQAYRDTSATCLGNFYASSRDGSYQSWFDSEGNLVRADDQSLETYGYSMRLAWDFENISIKTISSLRGFDSSFTNGSPAPVYVATNDNVRFDQDQSSHEINLSGSINDRIRWLAGIFYMEEEGIEIVNVRYPLTPPGADTPLDSLPLTGIEERNIDNSSQAFYGQLSFDLTDALEFTFGARQTKEEKSVVINKQEGFDDPDNDDVYLNDGLDDDLDFGPITPLVDSADITEPSVLANLSWDLSDDTMTYLLFSDGFRNGGFPARVPAMTNIAFEDASYGEEFVETVEWGIKTTALDGNLRANLAVFKSDYTDMQINATIIDPVTLGNVNTVQNVGDSEITGIELEASFVVTDNLRIDTSIGYLNTKLTSILPDANGDRQFFVNQGTNLQKTITVDTGVELPHAPELQANIGANYSLYLGNGSELRNRVDVIYESDQYSTIGNYDIGLIPSTTRINYMLTYLPQDMTWEVTLGARNLTDEEDILNAAIETGPRAGLYHVLGRGREAYLQFKYSFGE